MINDQTRYGNNLYGRSSAHAFIIAQFHFVVAILFLVLVTQLIMQYILFVIIKLTFKKKKKSTFQVQIKIKCNEDIMVVDYLLNNLYKFFIYVRCIKNIKFVNVYMRTYYYSGS